MDKERFSTLLKDPSQVTNTDIKALNEYRKKYPYFQSLYVVVAKALKDREHPKTEAFVKKAAIYSANRPYLKEIIEGKYPLIEEVKAKPVKESPEAERPKPENKTDDKPQQKLHSSVETKKEEPKERVEETTTKGKETSKDPLSENPAKKKGQQEPVKTEAKKEEKPKPEVKKVPQEAVKKIEVSKVSPVKEKNPETSPSKKLEPDQSKKPIKKVAEATQKPEVQKDSKIDDDLAEIEATKRRIEALLAGNLRDEKPKNTTAKDSKGKKHRQIEIIEKFIENEPQIDRDRMAEVESGIDLEDLADKSILKEKDFETETLAELLAKQGKVQRAEDIYKKLSLKFPEKSTYFASRIQKLKKK